MKCKCGCKLPVTSRYKQCKTCRGKVSKSKHSVKKDTIVSPVQAIYIKYKQRAKTKRIPFSLPLSYFEEHYKGQCYYCNDQLTSVGFDRVNTLGGYTLDNTVPCCTACNKMKFTGTYNDLITHCYKILTTHQSRVNLK